MTGQIKSEFSLKAVLLTATITLLIGGIGGTLFQEWINRARPSVTIRSIGFSGGSDLIEIPDNIVEASKQCAFTANFKHYITCDSLYSTYEGLLRAHTLLQNSLVIADRWLKDKSAWKVQHQLISVDDLLSCPITQDVVVDSTLFGAARRSEITPPPLDIEALQKLSSLTESSSNDKFYLVYLRTRNIQIPIRETETENEKRSLHCIALSLSTGSSENIYHYMLEFQRIGYKGLGDLAQMCTNLESLLLPASYITIEASFYNYGDKPDTIRPFCTLDYLHDDLRGNTTVMGIATPKVTELPKDRAFDPSGSEDNSGEDVKVEPFLPKGSNSEYVFLPPKTEVRMQLRARNPLGSKDGQRIKELYLQNILKCQITCRTLTGVVIKSGGFDFGQDASKELLSGLKN